MIVISLSELNDEKINLINKLNKIVELRLDLIFESFFSQNRAGYSFSDFQIADVLSPLINKITVPTIVTLRKQKAGGKFYGSEKERISFLKQILNLKVHYIDIEHDSAKSFFQWVRKNYPNVKIICSYHNTKKTPANLNSIFLSMQDLKPDIFKIATFATRSTDSLRMLSFIKEKNREGFKVCGICMGEKGRITRILAPVFNGYFSFARLDKNTAEGQFDAAKLEKRYGYLFLNENTSIYALIGKDVTKSYSHRVYNKIFSLENFKNIYVKIPLEKDELELFFKLIKKMPFKGLSITTPYKECCFSFLDSIQRDAKAMSSVNTACIDNKIIKGYNTDGRGVIDLLEKASSIKDKKVVVIGSGGAARAICYEAKKRGAYVLVLGKTKIRAKRLAKDLKVQWAGLDKLSDVCHEGYDIIINATSFLDPISEEYILPKTIALEMNSNPEWTPFLIKAKNKGCQIVFGFEVFLSQGRKQFDLWFDTTSGF